MTVDLCLYHSRCLCCCASLLQVTEVGGVKFWCYNAGHVLGAAMFMLEIAGVKVWYTYSESLSG